MHLLVIYDDDDEAYMFALVVYIITFIYSQRGDATKK